MFKNWSQKKHLSSSGQATVEYILLLVIVVLLARFVLSPLGEGVKQYSGALVGPGGYYSCLMEHGGVPGHDDIEDVATGEKLDCGESKLKASAGWNSELGSIEPGLQKASSASDHSDSSKNEASKEKKTKDPSSSPQQISNSSSKRGSKRGSSAGGDSSSNLKAASSTKIKRKKRIRKTKRAFKEEYKKPSTKTGTSEIEDFGSSKKRTVSVIIIDAEEEEEKKRSSLFRSEKKAAQQADEKTKKKGHLIASAKRGTDGKASEIDGKLPFEKFLKYLIILAILVAIFLVVFSQVMEFQNRE
ncbi:MAG: hypothetical protein ACR2M7_05460 [Bdellovibrionales bacterium]